MLPFRMIDAQHPRRTSDSFSGPAPILSPQFGPACPDPVVGLPWSAITSSHPNPLLSRRHFAPISPLDATLMDLAASVANKRLTAWINPLDATLTKNPGGGDVAVNWKPLCSEAACRRLFEGLFTR